LIIDVSFRAPSPGARSLAAAARAASASRARNRPGLVGTATVRGRLRAIWSFRAAEIGHARDIAEQQRLLMVEEFGPMEVLVDAH